MDVVAAALAAKQKTALSVQRGQHHKARSYFFDPGTSPFLIGQQQ
jgi:hypothetical protein